MKNTTRAIEAGAAYRIGGLLQALGTSEKFQRTGLTEKSNFCGLWLF